MVSFSNLETSDIKDKFELYKRIKNETRQSLLAFIYAEPRSYSDLMEFSNLKPGSLYHHLNVLEPLIEKIEHGTYAITDIGRTIVEDSDLINVSDHKPSIKETSEEKEETPQVGNSEHSSITEHNLDRIWLGNENYLVMGTIGLVTLLLGFYGVAFAGSAIYAVGGLITFVFDLFAFLLGVAALYLIEKIRQHTVYNQVKFIVTIRVMSMLPGVVVGLTLLLLYLSGVVPSAIAYAIIFTITLVSGTLLAGYGTAYLRGLSLQEGMQYALVPGFIDLLIGFVVLISQ